MLLDFDVPKSKQAVEKQRIVTNIITSQAFIAYAAKKVEEELENELPYIYTHNQNEGNTVGNEEAQSEIVRKRTFFQEIGLNRYF